MTSDILSKKDEPINFGIGSYKFSAQTVETIETTHMTEFEFGGILYHTFEERSKDLFNPLLWLRMNPHIPKRLVPINFKHELPRYNTQHSLNSEVTELIHWESGKHALRIEPNTLDTDTILYLLQHKGKLEALYYSHNCQVKKNNCTNFSGCPD